MAPFDHYALYSDGLGSLQNPFGQESMCVLHECLSEQISRTETVVNHYIYLGQFNVWLDLSLLLTLGAHAQRGLQYSVCLCVCVCVCVCVSVTSLMATPLTHRYKVRYESNANALLKVFDSWISLKILCSKVTALFAHLNEL